MAWTVQTCVNSKMLNTALRKCLEYSNHQRKATWSSGNCHSFKSSSKRSLTVRILPFKPHTHGGTTLL